MNGNVNGLYGGITDQSLSGIDNGTGYGVANGINSSDYQQQIIRSGLIVHIDANQKKKQTSGLVWKNLAGIFNFTINSSTSLVYSFLNNGSYSLSSGILATTDTLTNEIPFGNNPRTIQGWFKINSYPTSVNQTLVRYGFDTTSRLFGITISSTGNLFLWGSTDNYTSSNIVPLNRWINIACVYNSSNLNFFVNGIKDNGTTKSYNTLSPSTLTVMTNVDGAISKLLFYDRALSDFEIISNYNLDKNKYI
jgi:hypothetical protein